VGEISPTLTPQEILVKAVLFTLFLICASVLDANSSTTPEGCYKIEFSTEMHSFVAVETGNYTFKGGSDDSPNGYLITVHLVSGEVWYVPDGLASISHVVICPDESTTTTTTLAPTTTTTLEPLIEGCIHRDPAIIKYSSSVDKFKMQGRIVPVQPLDYSTGASVVVISDDVTILDLPIASDEFTPYRYAMRGYSTLGSIVIQPFKNGEMSIKVRYNGPILNVPNPIMSLKVTVGNQVFMVTGPWRQKASGWILRNKDYTCNL
jgi:hypothetical protein